MRRGILSLAAAMVVLAVASAWQGGYAKSTPATSTPVTSTPAPRATAPSSPTPTAGASSFPTDLVGTTETPPNKSTGTGTAKITVDVAHKQVCWNLSARKLQGTVTQAHIHRGPAGKAGPVVLTLSPPAGGSSHGCKGAGPPLVRGIVKHPDNYYANVNSSKFTDGEVRGQL